LEVSILGGIGGYTSQAILLRACVGVDIAGVLDTLAFGDKMGANLAMVHAARAAIQIRV
jgi:hypothetical protein